MSIYLGEAVLQGNTVTVQAPTGSIDGLRLTNYTGDVLVLTNIDAQQPSQQYLMPLQQMVYHTVNVSQTPSITGVLLGSQIPLAQLFVEWSTESLKDFIGTYPCQITQVALNNVPTGFVTALLAVPDDGTTYAIPADPARLSTTFFNDGANPLEWSYTDSGWGTNPIIVPTSGRELSIGAEVFFRGNGFGDSQVQWFGEIA